MAPFNRRWRLALIGGLATGIIVLAVLVGLFRIAVELVPGYREEVQSRVASLLQSPVQIAEMDLLWRGLYPTLQLDQVVVGAAASGQLELSRLKLGFSLWRLLRGDVTPRRVSLQGTRLQLTLEDGRIRPMGLQAGNTQTPPEEFLNRLLAIGDVELQDAQITWIDRDHAVPPRELTLQRLSAQRIRGGMDLQLRLSLPEQPGSLISAELVLGESPWQFRELEADFQQLQPWDELRAWLPQLPPVSGEIDQLRVNSRWQDGQWQGLTLDFELRDFQPVDATQALSRWSAQLDVIPVGEGLRLTLDNRSLISAGGEWPSGQAVLDLRPPGRVASTAPDEPQHWRVALDLPYARIEDLSAWQVLLPAEWQSQWQRLQPRGVVRDLVLQWLPPAQWPVLALRFEDLGFSATDQAPGLSGLSGSLSLDQAGGRLSLQSREVELIAPALFAQALPIDQIGGSVSWTRTEQGWSIDAPALHYAAMSLDGVGRLQASLGERPTLDLDLSFFCPDLSGWMAYQPLTWPKTLRSWLGRAVVAGGVSSGSLRINGALADFPFDSAPGSFRLELALSEPELKFAPDWPAVLAPDAALLIDGDRLELSIAEARIGALTGRSIGASIPSLKDAELDVAAQLQGNLKDVWSMLGASRLRRDIGQTLDAIDISGKSAIDLGLQLPLKALENTRYKAVVQLDRAALWTRFWPDPLKRIEGSVEVTPEGLRGRDIRAILSDQPVLVSLQPQGQGVTRLNASAELALNKLGKRFAIPSWLAARSEGSSLWRLDMNLGAQPDLKLQSHLQGTALALPPPYGKSADEIRSVDIRITPGSNTRLNLNYDQRLGLDMLLSDATIKAARLHLGGESLPAGAPGWWVEGGLAQASLEQWLPLIDDITRSGDAGADAPVPFGGLVLQIDELLAFEQRFPRTRLQLTQRDEQWLLGVSGERALGELTITTPQPGQRLSLSGEFERLNWGLAGNSPTGGSGLDPRQLPNLRLQVSNFALNDKALGPLTLAWQAVERGVRISTLKVAAKQQEPELDLSGLWLRDAAGSSGAFEFAMNTSAFRSWLGAFGYQRSLDAERGQLRADLQFAPHPDGLMPANLSGNLDFEFSKGQLLTVEPGAGRMLGLLSINAIPRRFALDFRDVMDTGLGFDRLKGNFVIDQGIARTDGLVVESTSLRVSARGAVDLGARTYDQTITIYPGVSSGVTLAATVLGGPAAGLIALLAQELLDKPLDQVTQLSYHLGGTWDNPQIESLQ